MRGSSFGYLVKEGCRSIYSNRMMSLASIGVLVACLLLIGSSLLFTLNVNSIAGYVESTNEVVVFIEDELEQEQVDMIDLSLSMMDNVANTEYISKEQALENEKEYLGDAAILFETFGDGEDGVMDNPFPSSFVVKVKDLSKLKETQSAMEKIDGVEKVNAPTEVADILSSIKKAVSTGGVAIVAILLLVSLVIIANTIKITVFNRRKEINIMKFVGATDSFIRLPFIVEGTLIGLLSALISFFLLWGGYHYLIQWVGENQSTWVQTMICTNIVPFKDIYPQLLLYFCGGGILIGVFGSMFFVRKYLKV